MKKVILSGILACVSFAIFAQGNTSTWTTDARTALFREAKEALAQKEPGINAERQSSIAIKYANAITTKYTSTEWAKKGGAEIKKIKGDILTQSIAAADKEPAMVKPAGTHTSSPK